MGEVSVREDSVSLVRSSRTKSEWGREREKAEKREKNPRRVDHLCCASLGSRFAHPRSSPSKNVDTQYARALHGCQGGSPSHSEKLLRRGESWGRERQDVHAYLGKRSRAVAEGASGWVGSFVKRMRRVATFARVLASFKENTGRAALAVVRRLKGKISRSRRGRPDRSVANFGGAAGPRPRSPRDPRITRGAHYGLRRFNVGLSCEVGGFSEDSVPVFSSLEGSVGG